MIGREKYKYLWHRKRYLENQSKAFQILGNKCKDCNENDSIVLEFDHVGEKKNNITRLLNGNWSRVVEELGKCELVCSNCHTKREYKRWALKMEGKYGVIP